MSIEIVKFNAKDGIILDGILSKCNVKTTKLLIQIHGMTSNCFKLREKTISEEVNKNNIDTLTFNNRGSEISKYIKNINGERFLGGTAYEDVEEGYYDIVGAIEYALSLGYNEIYLQGHSLGCTKIVYTYNRLQHEKDELLASIKAVLLLSLVDIPGLISADMPKEFIKIAEDKEKDNKLLDLMPAESFFHPISVKTFLRYTKYYENIDFARYGDSNDSFEILNSISIPLFMRWGNEKELIAQNAEELVLNMNQKISNRKKDINYIDGANHSYDSKEKQLANEICDFLVNN